MKKESKKGIFKKIGMIFLAVSIQCSALASLTAYGEESVAANADGMSAEFVAGSQTDSGLRGYFPSWLSGMTSKEVSGKTAYTLEGKGNDSKKTIYFSLNNPQFRKEINNGRGIEISVEYLDDGKGFFSLVYDEKFDEIEDARVDWSELLSEYGETPGQFAGFVECEDSRMWRTKTFYIRNAFFSGGLDNDADFYISLNNRYAGNCTEDVSIAAVTVKAMDTKSPARVSTTSNDVGNIFFNDSPVTFKSDIISTVDYDFDGELVLSALNINDISMMYDRSVRPLRLERDGTLDKVNILEQKREHITLKAGETVSKTVTFEKIKQYGCMTYRVELIDEKNNLYTVCDKAFSRVVRNSDEELNQQFGISMHYFNHRSANDKFADTGYDLCARAGISWIRGNVNWQDVESKRYNYSLPKGSENFMRRNVEKYGGKFHMYPILGGGNSSIGANSEYTQSNFGTKTAQDAFGEFAKGSMDLLKQYGVDTYEIINEPNLSREITAPVYAGILKSVNEKTKPYYPQFKIAGPTTSEVPVASDDAYIPLLFKNGGLDDLDIVAVHPYNWRFAPEYSGSFERLTKLRELCVQYGKPDIEIWGTENGYTTSMTKNPAMGKVGNDTGLAGQAAWQTRFVVMMLAEKLLSKVFVYSMHDYYDRTNGEHKFGISTGYRSAYDQFAAKPVLIALANASHILNKADCTDKIVAEDQSTYAYRFDAPGEEDVIAMWSTNTRDALTLSLGVNEVTFVDMYGNEQKLYSKDGIYDFVLDGTISYIKGKFANFEKVTPRIVHQNMNIAAVCGDEIQYSIVNGSGMDISVTTEGGEGVEVISNPVFSGNTAVGKLRLNDKMSTSIRLKLYNGDKLYSTVSYNITPADKATFNIESCEAYSKDMLNRWKVSVLVNNNRLKDTIGGYIKLITPSDVVKNMPDIKVQPIEAGKQRRISFYLPEMNKKYRDTLGGIFYLDDGTMQYFSLDVDFTVAQFADKAPKLDGVIEEGEWTRGSWLFMDKATQIRNNDNWKGPDDLSARANIMWDDDNMYLAVVVTDDIFAQTASTPEETWRNDSLQIALKCDMSTDYSAFNEMAISLLGGKVVVYRHRAEGTALPGLVTNIKGKIVRDEQAQTTTYEIAIPWSELVTPDFTVKPDISIAFSMMVNENDGLGRNGWIELTPGIGYEKDPRLFTRITLMK